VDVVLLSLLNGVSFGCLLFLLAAGFSLTFGFMGILNLSHGAFYMIGAYIGLAVMRGTNNFLLAVLIGGVTAAAVGIVVERGFLSHLYKQMFSQALLCFGFIYIFMDLATWIFGPLYKSGTIPSLLSGGVKVGLLSFPIYRLFLILVGLLVALGLWLFQEKTRVGAIIRAGVDNKEMTMGLGINIGLVSTGVFAFSAFVAGLAGVVGSPMMGVYPLASMDILNFALIVVVVGGLGSLQGALVGSLLVGLVDAFGKVFLPAAADYSMYSLLVIVLLFRPSGLLGRKI
jgi:branched-chain amino acid transport system permease protein